MYVFTYLHIYVYDIRFYLINVLHLHFCLSKSSFDWEDNPSPNSEISRIIRSGFWGKQVPVLRSTEQPFGPHTFLSMKAD